jgi:hypothetical protein
MYTSKYFDVTQVYAVQVKYLDSDQIEIHSTKSSNGKPSTITEEKDLRVIIEDFAKGRCYIVTALELECLQSKQAQWTEICEV